MACVEDRAGPQYLDRRHDVDAYIRLFNHLRDMALSRTSRSTSSGPPHRSATDDRGHLQWRVSTFSGSQGTCVAVAVPGDGRVLVRNSNDPEAATLSLAPAAMATWVSSCRAGDLDDLTA